jgi:hypothetical protein
MGEIPSSQPENEVLKITGDSRDVFDAIVNFPVDQGPLPENLVSAALNSYAEKNNSGPRYLQNI